MNTQPPIAGLALISDRNTCALIDQHATVQWYCPERFDSPALFTALLDSNQGGYWKVIVPDGKFCSREFTDHGSILSTRIRSGEFETEILDLMIMGQDYSGIIRRFAPCGLKVKNKIRFSPDYGRDQESIDEISSNELYLRQSKLYLYSSVALTISAGGEITFETEETKETWAYLGNKPSFLSPEQLRESLESTAENWKKRKAVFNYKGLFPELVNHSIFAIQQLSCGVTGGVLAAATTSLPEVLGGERNYDYRYVWVRDAALITGALSALDGKSRVEFSFLDFLYQAMEKNPEKCVYPLYTIDHNLIDNLTRLELPGYFGSTPVQAGNIASEQLQLDAAASVLISCYTIYKKYNEKPHWAMAVRLAGYICREWDKKENGIWEEGVNLHYTTGKIFCARALEMMAGYQTDPEQALYWISEAKKIREFVAENCMTATGAFANYAGSQEVDVSAALFALCDCVPAGSPEMLETVRILEEKHTQGMLFRRTLVEFDAENEGVFLAGTCWMAHYYAIAGKFEKSKAVLEAVKECANDLGYFSEEYDPEKKLMLGNFDQTFVHSSFICAANGLSREMEGIDTVVR